MRKSKTVSSRISRKDIKELRDKAIEDGDPSLFDDCTWTLKYGRRSSSWMIVEYKIRRSRMKEDS